jgi:4a-hydroxytetrahydrobiopterin dehydratase
MAEEIKILTDEEIRAKLADLPGWQYKEGKITKTYEFREFMDGIDLVNHLAPFCEKLDHHPDILIQHRKIKFELWRFDIGMRVTNYDFMVASKIEELYRQQADKPRELF